MNVKSKSNTTFSEWSTVEGIKRSPYQTWVGFEDSMDANEKYEILANGISNIYTESSN